MKKEKKRKKNIHSIAPPLTAFIEDERIRRKITKLEMAGIIGINIDTYQKNIAAGNDSGLREVELKRAYAYFGYMIIAVPENIILEKRHDNANNVTSLDTPQHGGTSTDTQVPE